MSTNKVLVACAALVLLAVPAWADWNPGDPYKMHYPQLPDPQGWDIAFDEIVNGLGRGPLADDWRCSETGYVDDVHLWVSFREDNLPAANEFVAGFVEIWSNVAAGIDADYSHPGDRLWGMGFDTNMSNVTMLEDGTGNQGWFEPGNLIRVRPDHFKYFQVNIDPVSASGITPFIQRQGEMYWLVSHMMILDQSGNRVQGKQIGWKTSLDHFMDFAVYGNWQPPPPTWLPFPPMDSVPPISFAFVITGRPVPEPAATMLVALALLACWELCDRV